jgi:hypothetical protein
LLISTSERYYSNARNDPQLGVKLTGSWQVVVGELDTYVHILEYENYGGYDKTNGLVRELEVRYSVSSPHTLIMLQQHREAYAAMLPYVTSRSLQLNQEFAFSQLHLPMRQGGIFELRTYQLKAGTLLEWETAW